MSIVKNILSCAAFASVVCTMHCSGNGNSAPDFVLNDLQSNRFYLSGQKGSVVLLNFWSVHCAPCLREMPKLQELADAFARENVRVVGICDDPGEAGYVESLLKGIKVTYTTLIDEKQRVRGLYRVTGLPTTFIIDYKGMVRYSSVGYADGDIEKDHSIIELLVYERDTKK